jgi:hypothetical protein
MRIKFATCVYEACLMKAILDEDDCRSNMCSSLKLWPVVNLMFLVADG